MVGALTWALSAVTGIRLGGAVRPRRVLLWLTCGYGLLGLVLYVVCGVLGWIFSFSGLLSSLVCGGAYCFLTWRLLPMSHGGEYVLSGLLCGGGGPDAGYESSRRQALYLGLLCYRLLGILALSHVFGASWFPVLVVLGGCSVSAGIRQQLSGSASGSVLGGDGLHWYASWGFCVLFCGLVALYRGSGGFLVLGLLGCVVSFSVSSLLPRLAVSGGDIPSLRRLWWSICELSLVSLGLLGLLL